MKYEISIWHMKIRFTYFDQHCVWTMSWFKMLYDCVRLTTGYLGRAKLVILRIQAFIFWGKIDAVNDATRHSRATCCVSELFSLSGWWSWDVWIVIQAAPNFGCKDVGCEVGCLQPDFDFWDTDSVTFARQKWFNSPWLHMKKLRNQATMLRKVTERKRTILPALLRRET